MKKRALRGLLVLCAALALGIVMGAMADASRDSPRVQAATGDLVATVNFDQPCASLGVGIAFDGTNLWYSCHGGSPNLHRADPTTGIVNASYTVPISGIGAISYDATRNVIWAAGDADAVYQIDLDAGMNVVSTALAFNTGDICGLNDGLAFDARNVADPNDDVFYYSDDCFTTVIVVYDMAGLPVESFNTCATGGHNSGLAVGGQLLFQADLFNNSTCVVDKTSKAAQFTYSTAVAGDPNFHAEDMECDNSTFAVDVMWSIEAFEPRRAHAFEIPDGTCGVGGVPEPGGPTSIEVSKTAEFDGRFVSGSIWITNVGENPALISAMADSLEVHFPRKVKTPPPLPEGSTPNWFKVADVPVANPGVIPVGESVHIDYSFDLCDAADFAGANSMRNVVAVTLENKPEKAQTDTVVTRSESFKPAVPECEPPDPCAAAVFDICVDGDGIASAGPGAFQIAVGDPILSASAGGNPAGLDLIDRGVINGVYDAGDDLMVEDPFGTPTCPTAQRDAVYNNVPGGPQDCVVLDPDGSLADGDFVTCDTGAGCGLWFRDDDGDGRYDEGEDLVVDVNGNGVFD